MKHSKTDMKKYLQDVENPEDITGLSKKYNVTITGTELSFYCKTLNVIAQDEDDADDIARQIYEDQGFESHEMNDSQPNEIDVDVELDEADK